MFAKLVIFHEKMPFFHGKRAKYAILFSFLGKEGHFVGNRSIWLALGNLLLAPKRYCEKINR